MLGLLPGLESRREVEVEVGGLLFVPWLAAEIPECVSPSLDIDGSVGFNRLDVGIASPGVSLSFLTTSTFASLGDVGFRCRNSRYFGTNSADTSAQHF
jgi:hypothetical protein